MILLVLDNFLLLLFKIVLTPYNIMKKILQPIMSNLAIVIAGISVFVFASCAHKQTSMSSSAKDDIVWNSATPITSNANEVENELTKNDFQSIVSKEVASTKTEGKLSFKEKIATKLVASKLNKAYKKMTPTQKADFKKELNSAKGSSGLKQAVIVILVGIGICILAGIFWSLSPLLGNLVGIIGLLVVLYGIWLALEELVF